MFEVFSLCLSACIHTLFCFCKTEVRHIRASALWGDVRSGPTSQGGESPRAHTMGCERLKGRSHPTRGGWVSQVFKLNRYITTLPKFSLFLYISTIYSYLCANIHTLPCLTDFTLYNRMLFHVFVSIFSSQPPLFLKLSLFCRSSCSSVRSVPRGCVAMAAVHGWLQCVQHLHRGLLTGAQRCLRQQTPRERSRLHWHRYVCGCSVLMHEQALEMSNWLIGF